MEDPVNYVLGFAMSRSGHVLMIEKKQGPSFNIGKLNGLGGKIEPGETPQEAMAREFREECGLSTKPVDWQCFRIERHLQRSDQTSSVVIHCFVVELPIERLSCAMQMTDEVIFLDAIESFQPMRCVYNVPFLLEMAYCWLEYPEHRWIVS